MKPRRFDPWFLVGGCSLVLGLELLHPALVLILVGAICLAVSFLNYIEQHR